LQCYLYEDEIELSDHKFKCQDSLSTFRGDIKFKIIHIDAHKVNTTTGVFKKGYPFRLGQGFWRDQILFPGLLTLIINWLFILVASIITSLVSSLLFPWTIALVDASVTDRSSPGILSSVIFRSTAKYSQTLQTVIKFLALLSISRW